MYNFISSENCYDLSDFFYWKIILYSSKKIVLKHHCAYFNIKINKHNYISYPLDRIKRIKFKT